MCRLMTTQLAEALEGYPLYSQDGKGKEAVCRAVFALGSVKWFILEGNREDDDVILFGIVVGLMEDEYGYVSLNELSDVELDLSAQGLGKLQVRQQQNFKPVPLKQIQDSRLLSPMVHGKCEGNELLEVLPHHCGVQKENSLRQGFPCEKIHERRASAEVGRNH